MRCVSVERVFLGYLACAESPSSDRAYPNGDRSNSRHYQKNRNRVVPDTQSGFWPPYCFRRNDGGAFRSRPLQRGCNAPKKARLPAPPSRRVRFKISYRFGKCLSLQQRDRSSGFARNERHPDRSAKGLGDSAQHAQGVSFIGRRLQTADLLLGRPKFACKVFLRQTCCWRRAANCTARSQATPAFLNRSAKSACFNCSSK